MRPRTSRLRLIWAAWVVVLGCNVAWLGCRNTDREVELGGETNWLAWCTTDADCTVGSCVCGVCASACAGEAGSCGGSLASACFAKGSFGYQALCDDSGPDGICLPTCNTSTECGEGSACSAGACLPRTVPTVDAPGQAPLGDPFGLFTTPWSQAGAYSAGAYEEVCPASAPCPLLEELLRTDGCFDVQVGCGLTYVAQSAEYAFWYESFGTPPVAAFRAPVPGGTPSFAGTRSIECDAVEIECSTCGRDGVRCEVVPAALPEPPPPASVPGCACEADANGDAHVSLACFCSLYDCPAYADIVASCPRDDQTASAPYWNTARLDACGKLWFATGNYRELELAYAPATGELLGATLSNAGPVTAPCPSYRVSAGEVTDCATTRLCSCSPELTSNLCTQANGPGAP